MCVEDGVREDGGFVKNNGKRGQRVMVTGLLGALGGLPCIL